MSLVRKRMVIDTNYMRSPALESFFRQSRRNEAIICDFVLLEMLKGDPLQAIPRSTEIFRKYGWRVKVLNVTSHIAHMSKFPPTSKDMIDTRITAIFKLLPKEVGLSRRGSPRFQNMFQELKGQSFSALDNLFGDSGRWLDVFEMNGIMFSPGDLHEIRLGSSYSPHLTAKILWLVYSIISVMRVDDITEHIMRYPRQAMQTYLFRYTLCMVLIALDWLAQGKQRAVKPERVKNDLVDANIATLGTMFDGVLSSDKKLLRIHRLICETLMVVPKLDYGLLQQVSATVPDKMQNWLMTAFLAGHMSAEQSNAFDEPSGLLPFLLPR